MIKKISRTGKRKLSLLVLFYWSLNDLYFKQLIETYEDREREEKKSSSSSFTFIEISKVIHHLKVCPIILITSNYCSKKSN
jgi:hypothetical protein